MAREIIWTCGEEGSWADPPTRLVRLDHGEYVVEKLNKYPHVGAEHWEAVNSAERFEFLGNALEDMLKQREQMATVMVSAMEALYYGVEAKDMEDGVATALTILEGGLA